ncbi:glucose-1-phosphate adenylyltransferase [Paenibacillus beijingensis]|uniref:Glucose-1-phosphate adenylyltransferase n=1 Tax=Paenibacillus beijingensis TaxID=1126833 RepID=A0A0D5NFY4_9BACL|nr:glucose-1-phosphate adenylyltransferase [Paenibacillus beijingensis]AJY73887.1 glucose-1-phosphate adenylyltransferase [Paenibacillus beijingensis]
MKQTKCVAMLLAGGEGKRLAPLTNRLAKPAVHFGGRYRIIDFPLSNCVNSGIDTVGILTQYMKDSIDTHIGEGDAWSNLQVSLLSSNDETGGYVGTADAIYQNLDFIESSNPEHVLIVSGDHIYHMDYNDMLQFHINKGASMTLAVKDVPWEEASRFGIMNTDKSYKVQTFEEKPANPKSNLASMGVYIFKWDVLQKYLREDALNPESSHDFGKDVIPAMLSADRHHVYAYRFEGYWRDVGTPDSLWEAHMDLLTGEFEIERTDWPMHTPEYMASSAIQVAPYADVQQSMMNRGCRIEGEVNRSILFQSVQIGQGSQVKESIIMPGARIGRNVTIHRAIIGEDAYIADGSYISGQDGKIIVIGAGEFRFTRGPLQRRKGRIVTGAEEAASGAAEWYEERLYS